MLDKPVVSGEMLIVTLADVSSTERKLAGISICVPSSNTFEYPSDITNVSAIDVGKSRSVC